MPQLSNEFVSHFGVKLRYDSPVYSDFMKERIRTGAYEVQEATELERIIQEGETVLELGAGIGFVTCVIAKNALVKKVISYETNPDLIPIIIETLENNDIEASKYEIRNGVVAVKPRTSQVDFYVHEHFWASSLAPIQGCKKMVKINVDDFNRVLVDLKPSMIVCDIEGGELELFKKATLTGVKKVYIETHQRQLGRRGMKSLFERFHELDFHYDQHHSKAGVVLFSHIDR